MRPRLLVLTTSYPRHDQDPAGHFVAQVNRALETAGFACDVVRFDHRGPLAALERGRLHELVRPGWRFVRDALGRHTAAHVGVVAHWLIPSAIVGHLTGLPVIGVAHGGDLRVLSRAPSLARGVGRRIRGLVTVDPTRAPLLRCRHVLATPMGVDEGLVGLPPSIPGPRVLFLGRLVAIKGLDTLLAAAQALPAFRFTIAGDGPERRLQRTAPSNVTWLGAIPLGARRELLQSHHVVCVPSRAGEGLPSVAVEALAAGRHVVASAVGGLPSLLDAPQLVAPDRPSALAATLERLVDVPSPAPRDDLAWSAVGPRIAAFVSQCLRPPCGSGSADTTVP